MYANAAGTPTIYTYSGAASLASCSYDGSGNLFIDSSNASRPFAELPKGGSSFISIKYFNDAPLGNMQWDGRYMAVQERKHGNQGPITIDRVQVTGTSAVLKSQTFMYANRNKQEGSGVQFWIQGDQIVIPTPSRSRETPCSTFGAIPREATRLSASEPAGRINCSASRSARSSRSQSRERR